MRPPLRRLWWGREAVLYSWLVEPVCDLTAEALS